MHYSGHVADRNHSCNMDLSVNLEWHMGHENVIALSLAELISQCQARSRDGWDSPLVCGAMALHIA